MEPPNSTFQVFEKVNTNKTIEKIEPPLQIINQECYKLYDNIFDLSQTQQWNKNITPESLLCKNREEYICICQFRAYMRTNQDFLLKNITDSMQNQINETFENRNTDKQPREIVIEPPKKKKFFNKVKKI